MTSELAEEASEAAVHQSLGSNGDSLFDAGTAFGSFLTFLESSDSLETSVLVLDRLTPFMGRPLVRFPEYSLFVTASDCC